MYSIVEYSADPENVFSVTSIPGKQTYPAQDFETFLTRHLPDGTLLAVGVSSQSSLWCLAKVDLEGFVTVIYQFPSGERLPDNAIYGRDGNYYGVSMLQNASG
jgi:hypothetical protein